MIAREVLAVNAQLGHDHIDLKCIDANYHHHPDRIAPAVDRAIRKARAEGFEHIFIGYADCGTGATPISAITSGRCTWPRPMIPSSRRRPARRPTAWAFATSAGSPAMATSPARWRNSELRRRIFGTVDLWQQFFRHCHIF